LSVLLAADLAEIGHQLIVEGSAAFGQRLEIRRRFLQQRRASSPL